MDYITFALGKGRLVDYTMELLERIGITFLTIIKKSEINFQK